MSLLDVKSAIERATRARLILTLNELVREPWTSLGDYAMLREIASNDAARRSLYRLAKTLAGWGVELEIDEAKGLTKARFGTREIAELIEPDIRKARAIVERIDAEHEGRRPDLKGLARETEIVNAEMISSEYRQRRKGFAWITRKHGIGVGRARKILISTGAIIRPPRTRLSVEDRLPRAVVDDALMALANGALVAEVAAILGCSERTARRFAKRHGLVFKEGRPFGPAHPCEREYRASRRRKA